MDLFLQISEWISFEKFMKLWSGIHYSTRSNITDLILLGRQIGCQCPYDCRCVVKESLLKGPWKFVIILTAKYFSNFGHLLQFFLTGSAIHKIHSYLSTSQPHASQYRGTRLFAFPCCSSKKPKKVFIASESLTDVGRVNSS